MTALTIGLILFVILLIVLASGLWVGVSLLLVGFISIAFFTPAPAGSFLATTLWDKSWAWPLTALPLFIWMGEILSLMPSCDEKGMAYAADQHKMWKTEHGVAVGGRSGADSAGCMDSADILADR